jgi:hypothetical protein
MAIVVGNVTPWIAWGGIDKCVLCQQGYFEVTFEFHYTLNGVSHYVSEGCANCTAKLVRQDAEYASPTFWAHHKTGYYNFIAYGLIEPFPNLSFKEDPPPDTT